MYSSILVSDSELLHELHEVDFCLLELLSARKSGQAGFEICGAASVYSGITVARPTLEQAPMSFI